MSRAGWRNLMAHKGRFLMTVFAVVLGVGFVVGSFVVTDTLRVAVDGLFTGISQGVDVSVRARSDLDSTGGPAARGRIPEALLETVRSVPGVAVAEGTVTGYAQMLDPEGKPTTTSGAPFLGVSWGDAQDVYPATLEAGRRPDGPDEVAVDRDSSDEYGLVPGTKTKVLLASGPRPVTVVGVFTFGETNSLLGARLTAFDLDVAQQLLGAGDTFDSIDISADSDTGPEGLAARISEVLPPGVEAVTQDQIVDEGTRQTAQFIGIFQNILLGFAGVALFVSAFYINNTFAIVLGQRTRELSLMRAVGAEARQIRRSVRAEALLIGVTASVLGILAGLGIAVGLKAVLASGGFELPTTGLVLRPRTWVAATAVGIVVTVASSVVPTRRATAIPPVVGMLEGYRSPDPPGRRILVGVALTVLGISALGTGLFLVEATTAVFVLLGVGAVGVFLGVSWLSPLVAVPASRLLAIPLTILGTPGRLARANAMRNPHRTARTASALMIGLALVTTVFVVGESVKRSIVNAIEGTITADFVVQASSGFSPFSPRLAEDLAALPEIAESSGVRFARFRFDGITEDLVAARATTDTRLVDPDVSAGRLADVGPGDIAVHRDVARDRSLTVGETVSVEFASGGPQDLTVTAIYDDATFLGNYFVDLDTFTKFYPANSTDFLAMARAEPTTTVADARRAIEKVLRDYPQLKVEDRAQYRASTEKQFNQLLVAVNALLVLALGIALLGIGNTLALSVMERTREIGLLRAVGMTQRQTRRMIRAEAAIVTAFGAVLGVGVGLVFGVAIAAALPDSVVTTVAVPVGSLVGVVVTAALFGMLAGLLPARRAARLNVLDAIGAH